MDYKDQNRLSILLNDNLFLESKLKDDEVFYIESRKLITSGFKKSKAYSIEWNEGFEGNLNATLYIVTYYKDGKSNKVEFPLQQGSGCFINPEETNELKFLIRVRGKGMVSFKSIKILEINECNQSFNMGFKKQEVAEYWKPKEKTKVDLTIFEDKANFTSHLNYSEKEYLASIPISGFSVDSGQWYQISAKIEQVSGNAPQFFFTGYKNGKKAQTEYFDIRAKNWLFKANTSFDFFKFSLRFYGKGSTDIKNISLSPFNSKEPAPSLGLSFYKNRNTSGLVDSISPLFPTDVLDNEMEVTDKFIREKLIFLAPFGYLKFSGSKTWGSKTWENNKNKTYNRFLHGLFVLEHALKAYEESKEPIIIKSFYPLIQSWWQNNQAGNEKNIMAWHDETTARRVISLIRFFDVSRKILNEEQLQELWEIIHFHGNLLAQSSFHKKFTNHGMFQDQALLIYSRYFYNFEESHTLHKLAATRLNEYFTISLSAEGVLLEHSPSYHNLIAEYIKLFGEYFGLEPTDFYKELSAKFLSFYQAGSIFGTHIIKPDATLPQLGDTEYIETNRSKEYDDLWAFSEEFLFAKSAGREGKKPTLNNIVFPDAGYAIFRNEWSNDSNSTFLCFNASYHSWAHHHNDDLSLTLYKGGDIFIDPGANGYDYNDPFTNYLYSSFAHNTLIVNEEGLDGLDKKYRATRLIDFHIDSLSANAEGINERFQRSIHKRKVNYQSSPNEILVVTDSIVSDTLNHYMLLWHLAPDISPEINAEEKSVALYRAGKYVATIYLESNEEITLTSTKGQTEPNILGWYFDTLYDENPTPISVLQISLKGSNAQVKTVVKFNEK